MSDELETALASARTGAAEVPALIEAYEYSLARLDEARRCISQVSDPRGGAMTYALGSLGRLEASAQSDLDLAFIFDSSVVTRAHAEELRARQIDALRQRFDIPEKTFRRAVDLDELIHNVGGRRDNNDRLTYRALLLTEGAWLSEREAATRARRAIFDVYARGRISRGRFLNSLANDLHRYYRTVCVDYRHKVEEQDKAWAIRSLKLRHSRKLWHLANVACHLWAVDAIQEDSERDDRLAAQLGRPTLVRLTQCMEHFGAAELCRPAILAYDQFLAALGDPETRDHLSALEYGAREASPRYIDLRENARRLDEGAQSIAQALWDRQREHLVRFCLL